MNEVQVALFKQGVDEQKLILVLQLMPVYPILHWQVKPVKLLFTKQAPLPEQIEVLRQGLIENSQEIPL